MVRGNTFFLQQKDGEEEIRTSLRGQRKREIYCYILVFFASRDIFYSICLVLLSYEERQWLHVIN